MASLSLSKAQIKELAVYLAIASIGFSVNVVSRVVYSEVFKIRFGLSVIFAYGTGMVVGFILTKQFAFDAKKSAKTSREMLKFFGVSIAALTVTFIFSMLFKLMLEAYFASNPAQHAYWSAEISKLNHPSINRELLAHLIGTGFGFFINFFGHKFFTFRSTGYWEKYLTRY